MLGERMAQGRRRGGGGEMKEEGRKWKEGGRWNKRKNGSCRTRKKMSQWQRGLALFHAWKKKKAGLPFLLLLLSSSSFNSRNLKAEGTPGRLCGRFFLEDTLEHVECRLKAAVPPDSPPVLLLTCRYTNPAWYYCLADQGTLWFSFFFFLFYLCLFKSSYWAAEPSSIFSDNGELFMLGPGGSMPGGGPGMSKHRE